MRVRRRCAGGLRGRHKRRWRRVDRRCRRCGGRRRRSRRGGKHPSRRCCRRARRQQPEQAPTGDRIGPWTQLHHAEAVEAAALVLGRGTRCLARAGPGPVKYQAAVETQLLHHRMVVRCRPNTSGACEGACGVAQGQPRVEGVRPLEASMCAGFRAVCLFHCEGWVRDSAGLSSAATPGPGGRPGLPQAPAGAGCWHSLRVLCKSAIWRRQCESMSSTSAFARRWRSCRRARRRWCRADKRRHCSHASTSQVAQAAATSSTEIMVILRGDDCRTSRGRLRDEHSA